MATDQRSGSTTPAPFAYFDPDSSSWKMCQGSLLEASGESCTTWPRQGTWDRGFVWDLPTSAPPTDASESSSLLPTPSAYESTPTDEFNEEVREHLLATHERLYLPGRKWHSQRTLSRMAGALLPTPQAADGHGGRLDNEETVRSGRRPSGAKASVSIREAVTYLPTPRGVNRASRRAMVDEQQWASPQLEQVAEMAMGELPREFESPEEVPGASRSMLQDRSARPASEATTTPASPDGAAAPVTTERMLPTPTSQDARQNALNQAEAQRNPATMWATMGRVHHGDHTSPRFGGGRPSSADRHPDQLTLEDA